MMLISNEKIIFGPLPGRKLSEVSSFNIKDFSIIYIDRLEAVVYTNIFVNITSTMVHQ